MALSTLDSVRCLKIESPAEGGSQTDSHPTEVNTLQDAIAAAGLFVDGPSITQADKSTYVDRTAQGMRFTDTATSQQLSNLVGASRAQPRYHGALADIIHYLPDGPGDGVASNATLVVNRSGPLLTSQTWFTDSSLQTKIFSETRAYPIGSPLPSSITYVMYSAGSAVVTVTDTITRSGPLETGRNRTWQ